jgi:transcriptional regulator with XRE-family HTH domain
MAKTPSLRRRRVATALRRLREQAGLSHIQAAGSSGFSTAKISRIEALHTAVTGDDARTLCEIYGVDKHTTDAIAELARQSRRRGWWHIYSDDVLGRVVDLLELEADARTVRNFEIDLVPGLLQTEAYAAAVIRNGFPGIDTETLQQKVSVRMHRQQQVRDREVKLWAIVGEAALRQPVGGATVIADQLDRLAGLADSTGTVQVLPLSLPGHPAMGVPYELLELRDGSSFAYLDTLTGGLYLEDEPEIEHYRDTWARLTASALDFHQSVEVIRRAADMHRSGRGGKVRGREVAQE